MAPIDELEVVSLGAQHLEDFQKPLAHQLGLAPQLGRGGSDMRDVTRGVQPQMHRAQDIEQRIVVHIRHATFPARSKDRPSEKLISMS